MTLKKLKDQSAFNISTLNDGLVAIFTCTSDSDLGSDLASKFIDQAADFDGKPVSVIFVTNKEGETDLENVILDTDNALTDLAPALKGKKQLGENLLILKKEGSDLTFVDLKEDPDADLEWVESMLQLAENYTNTEPDDDDCYRWGQIVPETAEYLCKDCGYIVEFKAGEIFPICEVCMAGEPDGPSTTEEGYWEKV